MAILVVHETGHFVAARRYGVDQSLPYFIPAPSIFGTLGALILLRNQPRDRGVLLNVAVAGPYAGLLVAVPLAAWGLSQSTPLDVAGPQDVLYRHSILFGWLNATCGPGTEQITLHPVALAGWVGLFITAINLIPAAQLDGGHIAYSILGHWQERVSTIVVVLLFLLGVVVGMEPGSGFSRGLVWVFWAVFLFVIGVRHPPVRNEAISPTRLQKLHGAVALLILVVTFTPVPFEIVGQQRVVSPHEQPPPFEPPGGDEGFPDEGDAPAEEFEL
jgi:membrane-associated protease RseP (regulator of RpoE activity)